MINNIVNICRINNIIDRVRSCIDVLAEILMFFRKTGNLFINTRCIDLVIIYTWLIQAGIADTSSLAYTSRYSEYWRYG